MARQQHLTIADMVAFREDYLPDVYEAFCLEDGNKYRFRRSNDVDPVLGKWRLVTEGGMSDLPTASATVKGGVKIGEGLTMEGETLKADVQSDENFTTELKEKLEGIDMSTKVDTEEGKGLSTNDLTDELKAQYDKAEENVQSDWDETDETVDSFIKGKPTKLSDFDNDEEFITKAVDNLENYYKFSETYTQSEINALVNAINSFELKKVDVLPTEDINPHCIYFVLHGDTEGNLFDEFIYIDGKWENLGPAVLPTSGKAEEVTYENPKHLELDNVQKALDAVIERAESVPKPESKDKLLLSTENAETSKLEWSQVDKYKAVEIPVYETMAAAEADIANLSENQIIATKDEGNENAKPVDVVEKGNMHAVTSNAVFAYVNNVEVIEPTINTDTKYNVLEVKVIKTGNLVSIYGIITVNSQLESVVVATGLPIPLITKLVEYDNFVFLYGQKGTNASGQVVKVDKNGNLIVYTDSAGGNYYFGGTYVTE